MKDHTSLKAIAIVGPRGIPADYGGFETATETLAEELAMRGVRVTYFCEDTYRSKSYNTKGVYRLFIPVPQKARIVFEPIFDAIGLLVSTFSDVDLIYLAGYSASPALIVPRLLGKPTLVNVDGLEWRRSGYGPFMKNLLRAFEAIAVRLSRAVVADSRVIAKHIEETYGIEASFVPYAARILPHDGEVFLQQHFGLTARDFFLTVCRIDPSNNLDTILSGYEQYHGTKKMVVVGDTSSTYGRQLVKTFGSYVRFLGPVHDKVKLGTLRALCAAYLHGHEVGGTNPSLLEAMGSGSPIIALDNEFNREVTDNQATYFKKDPKDIARCLYSIQNADFYEVNEASTCLLKRVHEEYSKQVMTKSFLSAAQRVITPHKSVDTIDVPVSHS